MEADPMETDEYIVVDEFVASHKIEFSFITTLQEMGLVQLTTIKETGFIPTSQLPKLEQFIRLHYDLEINPEGIDAINNLLERINNLQTEIAALRNKLRRYGD